MSHRVDRPAPSHPAAPPWINCEKPPAEFYRPIFQARPSKADLAIGMLTRIGAVLPVAPMDGDD